MVRIGGITPMSMGIAPPVLAASPAANIGNATSGAAIGGTTATDFLGVAMTSFKPVDGNSVLASVTQDIANGDTVIKAVGKLFAAEIAALILALLQKKDGGQLSGLDSDILAVAQDMMKISGAGAGVAAPYAPASLGMNLNVSV